MSKKKDNDEIMRAGIGEKATLNLWPEEREPESGLKLFGPLGEYNEYPSSYITQIVRDAIVYEDNLEEVINYRRELNRGNQDAKNISLIPVTDEETGKEYAAIQIGELIIHTPREVVTAIKKDENGEPILDENGNPVKEVRYKYPSLKRGIDAVRAYDFLGHKFLEETRLNGFVQRADTIDFRISELVDAKIYTRENNAKAGFKSAMDFLMEYALEGKYEKKVKGKVKTYALPGGKWQLFQLCHFHKDPTDARKTMCAIERITLFPWDETIEQFQMPEPKWIFEITGAPYLLVHEIFNRARLNAGKTNNPIRKISFRSVRFIMKLPSPSSGAGRSHPKTEIKTPIIDAVAQIRETFKLHGYRGVELKIGYEKGYRFESSLDDFLDYGYIEVIERGEFKEAMQEINSKRGSYLTAGSSDRPKGK